MSSAKWRPFCLGLNVLKEIITVLSDCCHGNCDEWGFCITNYLWSSDKAGFVHYIDEAISRLLFI